MGSVDESAPPLPEVKLASIAPGIKLLKPLSRLGSGPGVLVLAQSIDDSDSTSTTSIKDGFPSPALKWAEESYTVVELGPTAWEKTSNDDPLKVALDALQQCETCAPKETVGIIAFDPSLWAKAEATIKQHPQIVAAVIFDQVGSPNVTSNVSIPAVRHVAGKATAKLPRTENYTAYEYPSSSSSDFATPWSSGFHSANEAVAHTRSLTFLKKVMKGPYFDLEAIWDEHTYWEFEKRSTAHTMSTMVQEPYVNHVPTMTGGIGRDRLSDFYQNHFIFNNPQDTELELISRTVGIDRVIDEFIFKFTHDMQIDWLLPGVPPTYKRAEIPFTAVVNVRGDRLYHEHIAWDQATCLRQLGLMPEYLPFPYAVPGDKDEATSVTNGNGMSQAGSAGYEYEYRVPTAGVETANKMRDKNSESSNLMFGFQIRKKQA